MTHDDLIARLHLRAGYDSVRPDNFKFCTDPDARLHVEAAAALRELQVENAEIDAMHVEIVRDLRERAERAEAERDAFLADAERYRYLKANARRIDFAGLSWSGGELDARIDAFLAEKK